MSKKRITIDDLAMMVEVGFEEVTAASKDAADSLREDLMNLGYVVDDGFENLAGKFRPLSERLNTHDLELHELRLRLDQLEKPKRSARSRG